MENRSIGPENRNASPLKQHVAVVQQHATGELGIALTGEELHLLIEFFRVLDRWDRQEVVQ